MVVCLNRSGEHDTQSVTARPIGRSPHGRGFSHASRKEPWLTIAGSDHKEVSSQVGIATHATTVPCSA